MYYNEMLIDQHVKLSAYNRRSGQRGGVGVDIEHMITQQVKLIDVPDWTLILYQNQIFELESVNGPAISHGDYHAFIHELDGKETIPARVIGGPEETKITIWVYEND